MAECARSRSVETSRYVPAIMDTAAEIAPVAPANNTTWLLVALAATPKTSPKIDTVPSSIPKTMEPRDDMNDCQIVCKKALDCTFTAFAVFLASFSIFVPAVSGSDICLVKRPTRKTRGALHQSKWHQVSI